MTGGRNVRLFSETSILIVTLEIIIITFCVFCRKRAYRERALLRTLTLFLPIYCYHLTLLESFIPSCLVVVNPVVTSASPPLISCHLTQPPGLRADRVCIAH
jgi:hypothetical protein